MTHLEKLELELHEAKTQWALTDLGTSEYDDLKFYIKMICAKIEELKSKK